MNEQSSKRPSLQDPLNSNYELAMALAESVHLQSHYAKLLNMYDDGKRMQFPTPADWIQRLYETGKITPTKQLSIAQLEYICKEIIGKDDHGSFVKSFARAFISADFINQQILRAAAQQIVWKYGLTRHLPSCGQSE